ncbi:MAG: thioredoxin-dependent thiol peroxidase [Bacteroidota bacterium]
MGTHLKKGDQAPEFTGKDQNGNEISLSDYKGDKLVLYFYPKDDTPGCTKEACNLRDNFQKLQDAGIKILGVSADDEASHQQFIEKYELPFPLIADTDKEIINKYGVWGEKNMYGKKFEGIFRTTFLIDEDSKIHHVFKRVKTDNHTEQILEKI